MLALGFGANLVATIALAAVAIATGGRPPFWLFVLLLGTVLFFQQMLIPNLNAAAMRPLAHVAGTGAAILGMVSGTLGAVIGGVIDRLFDGTVTPLAIGFVVSSAIAAGGVAAPRGFVGGVVGGNRDRGLSGRRGRLDRSTQSAACVPRAIATILEWASAIPRSARRASSGSSSPLMTASR